MLFDSDRFFFHLAYKKKIRNAPLKRLFSFSAVLNVKELHHQAMEKKTNDCVEATVIVFPTATQAT